MKLVLTGKSISNGRESENRAFLVDGGKITRVGGLELKTENPDAEIIDLRECLTLPGLIDTHVHGGNSYDTMDGTYEALNGMSLFKIKEGVTSFIPTTVTASDEMTDAAIKGVGEAVKRGVGGAKIAGLFLEGPYINPKNKGAHPQEFIKEISLPEILALVEKAQAAIPGKPLSIAVAPELPGAAEAIKKLTGMGVRVRIGHSSATLDEADAGVEAGAAAAIHTYNAMSPLNHREPGLVGAVLTNENLYGEIICDLVHVHAKAVRIVATAKGADKTVLITDCMRAGGLPDGESTLGELPVIVKDGIARLKDGALAGSTATLLGCVKKIHERVGVPLADAVSMATCTPAKAAGIFDAVGSLDENKRADIIAVDGALKLKFVMVDGEVKFLGL
ncbi:MAG: N-acetylglucosamine-6-phosphate deacetylase [Clostridiales bacterium]|jgi:N-acetylglucosamine-6-phosphate deacetylase|nr:N-acetylglucosamine-6-phosphate deacetylase [Clostridiales bacterium]